MNKEYTLKLIAMIGALFIAYLWSGGVWEFKDIDNYPLRINKITGSAEYGFQGEWKPIK